MQALGGLRQCRVQEDSEIEKNEVFRRAIINVGVHKIQGLTGFHKTLPLLMNKKLPSPLSFCVHAWPILNFSLIKCRNKISSNLFVKKENCTFLLNVRQIKLQMGIVGFRIIQILHLIELKIEIKHFVEDRVSPFSG